MVLGGQHISAALYQRYMSMQTNSVPISEDSQYVRGTVVMKASASKKMCRMAAAYQQSIQQNVQGVSLVVLTTYLAKLSIEKLEASGSPVLGDRHLLYALTTCGISYPLGPGGEHILHETAGYTTGLTEYYESVCPSLVSNCNSILFCFTFPVEFSGEFLSEFCLFCGGECQEGGQVGGQDHGSQPGADACGSPNQG